MPYKDLTEVAERGASLSGGQKARLTLARCFFSNRDIYLLDDVLSSTNKAVADSIFKNSVKDLLSTKTVLMVTSNPEASHFFTLIEMFICVCLYIRVFSICPNLIVLCSW
jgi:ABC-type transport system involved in cytochrome bd biosynthesis fused ATPase/permease subunit